jgi:hypothetical protein
MEKVRAEALIVSGDPPFECDVLTFKITKLSEPLPERIPKVLQLY